ncbi:MAG TPA: hypothetical protein VHN80_01690 [Kineosporiaceae bacterium]|nr:hypothetical protein [Kineosporiaceae bacterium]
MLHKRDDDAAGARRAETRRAETTQRNHNRRHVRHQMQRHVRGRMVPQVRKQARGQLRRGRAVRRMVNVLAGLLVLFALLVPNQVSRVSPGAFLRIPVEGLFGVAAVLALPLRARRPVAALAGAALGVLTIGKFLDMGFFAVLSRPFDPLFDWAFVGNAVEFVTASMGKAGAVVAAVAVLLLALAVVVLVTLSALRLTRLVDRHTNTATATAAVLAVAWVACAGLGVQAAPGEPVAARDTVNAAVDRAQQVRTGEQDQQAFAAQSFLDAARASPSNRLLTGLRGKDVIVAFVESYGRSAIEDPAMAPQVGKVLDDGNRRLRAAGFSSRSAFLTSPTSGGGSWLAQSTLLSGMWINNQQRYLDLVKSNRQTLNSAFRRAGWRTVGVVPGVIRDWPESAFFGFDRVYDAHHLGYAGPKFTWSQMPDQYTLASFERLEHAKKNHAPIMAEIPLTSSHNPWAPLPRMVNWKGLGDGTVFGPIAAAGQNPKEVWKDPVKVRTEYRRSIEYSLESLISYIETYGDDNLVVVFLGDHQPVPIVTGEGASRDVPITVVARDRAVLDRISSWGWQDGLKPSPNAPVWRMDSFRDRFLKAFGPDPTKP